MAAVPGAPPPPAAGAPAAGAAAGGGVDSVFEGSPPPQAARMTRAPALMRAREFRTIIGKAPLKIVWGSKLAQGRARCRVVYKPVPPCQPSGVEGAGSAGSS